MNGIWVKYKIIIDMYLIVKFGTKPIHLIKKTDVLAFRSSLAKVTYGKANKHLSAARINSIMVPLGMILKEAAKRYKFDNPYYDINALKQPKTDIQPFTLDEVWKFINGSIEIIQLINQSIILPYEGKLYENLLVVHYSGVLEDC